LQRQGRLAKRTPIAAKARTPAKARAVARVFNPTAAGNRAWFARFCPPFSPRLMFQPPMPANQFNGHTDYGIGIGLRMPHYDHILKERPTVAGLRLFPKISWATPAARWRCSTVFWSNTAWCSTAFRCILARPRIKSRAPQKLKRLVSARTHPGCPTTSAGVVWTDVTRTICCPCPIPSPPPG